MIAISEAAASHQENCEVANYVSPSVRTMTKFPHLHDREDVLDCEAYEAIGHHGLNLRGTFAIWGWRIRSGGSDMQRESCR